MTNTRRQRTRANTAEAKAKPSLDSRHVGGGHRSRARTRKGIERRVGWSRWAIPFTLVTVALLGLVAWRMVASNARSDSADSDSSARSIATLNASDFHSLLVDPQNPEHIFFGSHAGMQESQDGGYSWKAGELRNADAMQLAVSPKAPETLYATGHDVFQVSRDGGHTWQPLAHNLPGTDIHGFAQDPLDPNRLYAFVTGAGTFTSVDGGTTWQSLPAQPPGGAMHLALASSGTSLYAATEAGLVASSDQGVTWAALAAQPSGGVISLAIPASDPQTIYAGTESGLATSADGGASWKMLGPPGVLVLALAVAPTDPSRVLFVSDKGAVYRSDTGGTTWRAPDA